MKSITLLLQWTNKCKAWTSEFLIERQFESWRGRLVKGLFLQDIVHNNQLLHTLGCSPCHWECMDVSWKGKMCVVVSWFIECNFIVNIFFGYCLLMILSNSLAVKSRLSKISCSYFRANVVRHLQVMQDWYLIMINI